MARRSMRPMAAAAARGAEVRDGHGAAMPPVSKAASTAPIPVEQDQAMGRNVTRPGRAGGPPPRPARRPAPARSWPRWCCRIGANSRARRTPRPSTASQVACHHMSSCGGWPPGVPMVGWTRLDHVTRPLRPARAAPARNLTFAGGVPARLLASWGMKSKPMIFQEEESGNRKRPAPTLRTNISKARCFLPWPSRRPFPTMTISPRRSQHSGRALARAVRRRWTNSSAPSCGWSVMKLRTLLQLHPRLFRNHLPGALWSARRAAVQGICRHHPRQRRTPAATS